MLEPTDLLDEVIGDVEGRDVLDVGCGAGWLVRRMAAAGARAVGVDPLAAALERARAERSQGTLSYRLAGAQELPFEDASFDVVVFFNSLHHVPVAELDDAVREACRVLRPGGLLVVQEPLARGEFFELMRSVHDETDVRERAQEALDRCVRAGALTQTAQREADIATRLADFAALARKMVGVDPDRGPAIEAHEEHLRSAFEHAGHAVATGREFAQPVRMRAFRPA